MSQELIKELMKEHLLKAKTIAVVGFSKDPSKTAYRVPKYLTSYYKVYPVNPNATEIDGLQCYKSLLDIPEPVDIVNVFRPGPDCSKVMKDVLQMKSKPQLVWLQLHITNTEVRKMADDNNIDFVEDKCIMVEHKELT